MPHVSRWRLNKKVWQSVFDLFLEALARAKNKAEAEVFVTGFLAPTERIMLAKRFAIFFLLERGVERREIKETLKVSYATVSRTALWRDTLSKEQREFISRILRRREFKNFLVDSVKDIYYTAPTRGTDWKRWGKGKFRWEMERKELIR